jgi:hypothetical protein
LALFSLWFRPPMLRVAFAFGSSLEGPGALNLEQFAPAML